MPSEGVSSPTKVFFWSGDEAYILRTTPLRSKDGRNFVLLHLQLDDYVRWRYGITDKDLNFKIETQGTYAMPYPRHLIHRISDNPEHPMVCGFVNFDGSAVIDTVVAQKSYEIQQKDDIINAQEAQIERLQRQLKTALEQVSVIRRKRMEIEE